MKARIWLVNEEGKALLIGRWYYDFNLPVFAAGVSESDPNAVHDLGLLHEIMRHFASTNEGNTFRVEVIPVQ